MEESVLRDQIKGGIESAFDSIFKELYAPLSGYAVKYLKDLDQSEEVVQDVFCNLWEKRQKINITTSLSSYLYTSVRNRCLNEIRRQKNTTIQSNHGIEEIADNDTRIEEIELDQRIEQAIQDLPEMSRKVFEMSRSDGMKYKEIADKLGVSIKAVEANMSRALKKLRNDLKDYIISLIIFFLM
jgi:RNA polymerase sigma-70 factor (ECF subfamily)